MEWVLFLALVFFGAIFYLWRSRVRTSNDVESLTKGLPDDLRDKNSGIPDGASTGTAGWGGHGGLGGGGGGGDGGGGSSAG